MQGLYSKMKTINSALLVALMVTGAGCVSTAQKDVRLIEPECAIAKHDRTLNENCDTPKLGWKGANGSSFTIGH